MIKKIAEVTKTSKVWRLALLSIIILFSILILISGAVFILKYNYQNKIYPGITVSTVDLGGLTKTQAQEVLSGKMKITFGNGYIFTARDIQKTLTDPDRKIFNLNTDSIVDQAYNYGRNDSFLKSSFEILTSTLFNKNVTLDYRFDKEAIKTQLQEQFAAYEKPSKNANLEISILDIKSKSYNIEVLPSTTGGSVFDYNLAINELEKKLILFDNSPTLLTEKNELPKITSAVAEQLKDKMIKILEAVGEVKLNYEKLTETIPWESFATWLTLGLNEKEEPDLILDETIVKGQLTALSQKINITPIDAKLQMKDNKVTEFQASQTGLELDIEASYQSIKKNILEQLTGSINLTVNKTEPQVSLSNINNLGLKEIIGVGTSDFSGSPANRRTNIGVGAASVHGVLIAPNEEFSLVKILGDVDAEHGYLPELVIKLNETIPEFGGGLCQIATTAFRAALDAGLKITERKNHSYRVVYYEPAGTDATIYIPKPDVRFLNDTENYILFQSTLKGNTVTFTVWGTDDGRKIQFDGQNTSDNISDLKPKIFNVTTPGPAKMVETTALKPGVKKQTESSHNGADTSFSRTITYADGRVETETWKSHYVPWQAVILVGVDPVLKEQEAKEAQALLDAVTTLTPDQPLPPSELETIPTATE